MAVNIKIFKFDHFIAVNIKIYSTDLISIGHYDEIKSAIMVKSIFVLITMVPFIFPTLILKERS